MILTQDKSTVSGPLRVVHRRWRVSWVMYTAITSKVLSLSNHLSSTVRWRLVKYVSRPVRRFIFIYPQLLLRLEKYPHRMNFEKGILETRKQHYRHLSNLLVSVPRDSKCWLPKFGVFSWCYQKTIPLNTPTEIELSLGNQIRVTLLDVCLEFANIDQQLTCGGKSLCWGCYVSNRKP